MAADHKEIRRLCKAAIASIRSYQIPPSLDKDDLMQEGSIRLWQYMQSAEVTATGYLVTVARSAMIDAIRRAQWVPRSKKDEGSLNMEPLEDYYEEPLPCDAIGRVNVRQVIDRISAMPSRAKDAAELLASGLDPSEVAAIMGVHPSRVTQYRTELRALVMPLLRD